MENCFIIATIGGILAESGWYYLSCKRCGKKVTTVFNGAVDNHVEGNMGSPKYYCAKCKTYTPELFPRFVYTTIWVVDIMYK